MVNKTHEMKLYKMKLRLKTTFLALTILQLSLAQQIDGTWNGKLNVQGQEIPLVFHFTENKKEIKGTMDSPSQGASGIPIDKVTFKKNELSEASKKLKEAVAITDMDFQAFVNSEPYKDKKNIKKLIQDFQSIENY